LGFLFLALAAGCGHKAGPTTPAGGPPGSEPDSAPAHTLTVREGKAGDKLEVTTATTGFVDFSGGKDANAKLDQNAAAEYTETIGEVPAGAVVPTKLTRAYKKATTFEFLSKMPKPLGYEGKTVMIEKKGAKYEFTAAGQPVTGFDAIELEGEFRQADKRPALQVLLPKQPVKIGEPWAIEASAVQSFLGGMPFVVDPAKSKATGKLTKAHQQDGRAWGAVAFDFDLAVTGEGGAAGTVKLTGTLDAVTDGSSPDHTLTMTLTANVADGPNRLTAEVTRTRTVKAVGK
ncbi:MAG: hypothetical protein K2V38_28030, partial [Gemmataceae bacterium]|nr:hypothetical protein [Gemmataceae bacterium]